MGLELGWGKADPLFEGLAEIEAVGVAHTFGDLFHRTGAGAQQLLCFEYPAFDQVVAGRHSDIALKELGQPAPIQAKTRGYPGDGGSLCVILPNIFHNQLR